MIPQFLTDQYPLEQHLFLIPKYSLRLIGCDPESAKTYTLYIWAAINFINLASCCTAELTFGIYNLSTDPLSALDALCPAATSTMSLFKMISIWMYRDEFSSLMQRIRVLLLKQENSEPKNQLRRELFTLTTRLSAIVFFLAICTTTTFTIRPLVSNLFRYLSDLDYAHEMPFKLMLPQVLCRMPMYPITYIYIAWHGFITPFSFVGSDCMFFSYCLYITALLKCVQLDIISTLAELTDNDKNSSICEQKLKLIIERHNEISVLTERFSKIMAITTLSHFVSSSMIIGTSVVAILFLTGIGIVLYVVYTICVTMELFLFCYGGSAVIESSQEVSEEAYCSYWYKRDKNIQKMVLLLMLRAQRPLVVQVPFFAPSLPAFASILRFTGSLIALVKSFL